MPSARPTDIRLVVDDLLARPKRLEGIGDWTDDHRRGESRMVLQLSDVGEVLDLEIQIKVQRNSNEAEFVIMMIYGWCVWRVCFGSDVEHVNRTAHPGSHLSVGLIEGPHYHSWEDNHHLGSAAALPKRLLFGNALPAEVSSFAEAFRWFCDQTNVEIDDDDVPDLPPPDLLI